MKFFGGIIVICLSLAAALYLGLWLMFIKPIIDCCMAFDAGTLTGVMVGICVLKCIFASTVGSLLAVIGTSIGIGICES